MEKTKSGLLRILRFLNSFVILRGFFLALMVCGSVAASMAEDTAMIIGEADFRSDINGILRINNHAPFDAVVFAGKVERGNFMGAIKARGSREFDLSKIDGIPEKGAFMFRVISRQTLDKKGKTGITEEDVVYTDLVVYDLSRPDRKIERSIFGKVDDAQETFIYVSNLSRYVLELRISDGEKVGVLSPGQRNKRLWIKPPPDVLSYRIFPTYVYVDPNTGEINAFTDKIPRSDRYVYVSLKSVYSPIPATVIEFGTSTNNSLESQYQVAFIHLENKTEGDLSLETDRGKYARTTKGTILTVPGGAEVYEVASLSGEVGQTYTGMGVGYEGGYCAFSPPLTVKPGYAYTITVTETKGVYRYEVKELGSTKTIGGVIDLFME
jgi:hypothetical protein